MPKKKPAVHTVPRVNGWRNVQGGKTISKHVKKSTATSAGRKLAIKSSTEHRVQNKDGKISGANSYGNDPFPPKG
uniref:DUF2188 domain-containing protein n=1 Tax=uncultured Allobacillus sp. TaxID=1638025 RepID=UPI002598A2DE|nr:DUF2188 domain-containing protein [uncultured Allobacillus sp.]